MAAKSQRQARAAQMEYMKRITRKAEPDARRPFGTASMEQLRHFFSVKE